MTLMIPSGPPRVILLGTIVLGVVQTYGLERTANVAMTTFQIPLQSDHDRERIGLNHGSQAPVHAADTFEIAEREPETAQRTGIHQLLKFRNSFLQEVCRAGSSGGLRAAGEGGYAAGVKRRSAR